MVLRDVREQIAMPRSVPGALVSHRRPARDSRAMGRLCSARQGKLLKEDIVRALQATGIPLAEQPDDLVLKNWLQREIQKRKNTWSGGDVRPTMFVELFRPYVKPLPAALDELVVLPTFKVSAGEGNEQEQRDKCTRITHCLWEVPGGPGRPIPGRWTISHTWIAMGRSRSQNTARSSMSTQPLDRRRSAMRDTSFLFTIQREQVACSLAASTISAKRPCAHTSGRSLRRNCFRRSASHLPQASRRRTCGMGIGAAPSGCGLEQAAATQRAKRSTDLFRRRSLPQAARAPLSRFCHSYSASLENGRAMSHESSHCTVHGAP